MAYREPDIYVDVTENDTYNINIAKSSTTGQLNWDYTAGFHFLHILSTSVRDEEKIKEWVNKLKSQYGVIARMYTPCLEDEE